LKDLFSVDGKVIVVTGGLGQLGRQFSLALVDRGARVAVFDLQASDSQMAQRFTERAHDDRLMGLAVDVTSRASLEAALAAVIARWGAPHGLINNAALDSPPNAPAEENGPFEGYLGDSWDKVMQVNVKGVMLACQVVGGALAQAGRGSIINISSIYGMVSPDQRLYEYRRESGAPFYKPAAYGASKSALLSLTRYLATYWAPHNVRVNTLTFGGVFNQQDQRFLDAYSARVPLGRMAREDEYNGAVIFLLSDAASYMTGANMVLDGGWTAW
jgi:NAD(P)-dependent dehydrogenase (short-subunit alcohol dehydrogenase family)